MLVPAATDREVVAAGTAFGLTADPDLRAVGVDRVPLGGDEFFLRVVWRTGAAVHDVITAALEAPRD